MATGELTLQQKLAAQELKRRETKEKPVGKIVSEAAQKAAKETLGQAANLLNGLLGGIPDEISKKVRGQSFVPKDINQRDAFAGKLLGLTQGIVGKTAGAVGGAIKGTTAGARIARGAVTGGVGGALIPPEENWGSLVERGKQAISGAFIGAAIGSVMEGARAISKRTSGKQAQLARIIRQKFYNVKRAAVNKFGAELDDLAQQNPGKTVSLREVVEDINNPKSEYDDATKRIFRRIPKLGEMLEKPKLANEVSLKDTQEIINHINTKIPANIKYNNLDLLDTQYSIKAAQLDAFPGMETSRANYAKVLKPYNEVKSQFKFNRVLKGIQNDFGGPEGKEAVKELFQGEEKLLKKMGDYKNVKNFAKVGKTILNRLIWMSIYYGGLKKVTQDLGGSDTTINEGGG